MFYDPYDIQDAYDEDSIMFVQGPMQLRPRPGEMGPEDMDFDEFGPADFRRDRDLIDEITEAVIREAQDFNYFGYKVVIRTGLKIFRTIQSAILRH